MRLLKKLLKLLNLFFRTSNKDYDRGGSKQYSDNEIIGAILDASFRVGLRINDPMKAFFNIRYLGGGAVGTSDDNDGPGDGYVRNWLHFLTVSVGAVYTL